MAHIIQTTHLNRTPRHFSFEHLGHQVFSVQADGSEKTMEVLHLDVASKSMTIRCEHLVYDLQFKNELDDVLDTIGMKATSVTRHPEITAPMPGKVVNVMVKSGDVISKDTPLLVLEAMKMENVLKAESDGVIEDVKVRAAENVEKNQVLIQLKAD